VRPDPDDGNSRVRSRRLLSEAETAMHEFRSELRTELRMKVANGVLEPEVVDMITTGLRDIRRNVIAALRG
jgi:hypothetical protein